MQYKSLGFLLLTFALAGLSGWAVLTYLEKKEQQIRDEVKAEINPIKVVVAAHDLNAGDIVSTDTMVLRDIPSDYVPDGAVMPDSFDGLVGTTLTDPVGRGKPLLRSYLKGMPGVANFSQLLKEGERGLTIDVDAINSNENMIVAGDLVDLVMTDKVKGSSGSAFQFAPLLEKVRILAVGDQTIAQGFSADEGNKRKTYQSITVAVKVKDVAKVLAAKETQHIAFMVRNEKDDQRARYVNENDTGAAGSLVESLVGGQTEGGVLKPSYSLVGHSLPAGFVSASNNAPHRFGKYMEAVNKALVKVDPKSPSKSGGAAPMSAPESTQDNEQSSSGINDTQGASISP